MVCLIQVPLLPDRLVARKIRVEHRVPGFGPCWVWLASVNKPDGYGQFVRKRGGQQLKRYVHRYTFELFVGEIPEGWEVHHECGVRVCCNPDHLEARPPEHNWANQYVEHV